MPAPFRIEVVEWGNGGNAFSQFNVYRGKDPRRVEFRGDAYWQWMDENPERSNGKGFCWTQALHDALEGWHSCILHAGDTLFVLPKHPDYERVEQLWTQAQKKNGHIQEHP